jgi:alkylation response protein AidB-like acyl-CoA dehydrogenase
MTAYNAPLRDMRFVIEQVIGLDCIEDLPGLEAFSPDLVEPVLEEASHLASGVLAPLNWTGDREGARLEGDAVHTPKGFAAAYKAYADAGWNSVPFDPEYGGQGLPWLLAFAVQEMWQSANMAFGLCPLLNQGAVEAISAHGSPEQKALYLEKLIAGTWTGTMNLTEPQAGSDLAAVRTKAVRDGDHFRLTGQKIYITYGEHDFTPNIIHMVLARIEGAPEGVKGISLFLAPKFLANADGSVGARNDLRCISLEHKLGIHASPTAVMSFGDNGGATAWLVGEENRGLEYMFTMMNNARLSVGLQGVAIAERAYQQALDYAKGRVQGRTLLGGVSILGHPDVRRMLLHMKVLTESARALTYYAASQLDIARHATDEAERSAAQARVDLLTPIVKGWGTDIGNEVASLGVQVHGGMGFIEETGAAQHLRDARITPIYEGTNGIQANDLTFRKTARDQGVAAKAFVAEMRSVAARASTKPGVAVEGQALAQALDQLEAAIGWICTAPQDRAASGAYSYLRLFGLVATGYMAIRAALVAGDDDFGAAKRQSAAYHAVVLLPQAEALAAAVTGTHESLLAFPVEQF